MDAYTIDLMRLGIAEEADFRTRKARQAIKDIAPYLTAPEALALIQALIAAFGESMELKTSTRGVDACDYLLSAVATLEE